MKISSYNEWDTLREVVVGTATHANWPKNDPVFNQESSKTTWLDSPVPSGAVAPWIIQEANEDLQILADTLSSLGVKVHRPQEYDYQAHDGMYGYCPRDRLLVYGDQVVDCTMMYPCREQEISTYTDVLHHAGQVLVMEKNLGHICDAANVLRLNDKWLYLRSASGNALGYQWLSNAFPDVTIESCNFYAGVHIDSTITPLREGLVVLNASRVTPENLPLSLKNWDKIWVDDVVAQGFHEYPFASKWIAMNMLAVDPSTVIVDQEQTALIRTLEQHKFQVIPLQLRHSRTLGGGFHCVTLDLHRS
jgi:glycine amidinotransferase/scyllo-inosamine-4-phosphate amidinotransferase 1